jgi:hypothetical protein
MDGRRRWMDNVLIERLWRSLKHCGKEAPGGVTLPHQFIDPEQ